MIHQCSWSHPGANPYTGTAEEWIAKAPLNSAESTEILDRIRRNDFTDIVYISRDGITSANPAIRNIHYDPHLSFMAFGSRGDVCNEVSILDLPDVQSALVFCSSDGVCVARPSICNNWTILLREPEQPPIEPPPAEGRTDEVGPSAPVGLSMPPVLPATPDASPPVYAWFGGGGDSFGGFPPVDFPVGGGGGYCPPVVPTPPIPPVPEPATWAIMLTGLFSLLHKARKGKRTSP